MSSKSNNQGRAYEFAYIITLQEEISKYRKVQIDQNDGYLASKKAWETLDENEKSIYKQSALAGIRTIFRYEPLMLEVGEDVLWLKIQTDDKGKVGDVRDILIIRNHIRWEIGISVKHNHFAVKHSRLSHSLDFGEKWYGCKCSQEYWSDVKDIFETLKTQKAKGLKWSELESKDDEVYVPLLRAFKDEILRKNEDKSLQIPHKMVEYLLGQFDFYKAIGIDKKKITQIQSYNLKGTLNQDNKKSTKKQVLPIVNLPTRIVCFDFKPNSKNTLEMYLDEGWQFSFRLHNASTKIEPSLKFDVGIIGMPTSIITINCQWV